jgi:two-component system, chemotaxis family, protein-glutamate methylesterase/glutaminase
VTSSNTTTCDSATATGGIHRLADKCVVIGISTGGPPALAQLFAALHPPLPPILIVQHMPAAFTRPLAERLNGLSEISVSEATDGASILPNKALLAPGGKHLRVRRFGSMFRVQVFDGPAVSSHKPSIDVLMTSVAETLGQRSIAMIMTGMGRDGVAGCAAIRKAGGFVLGQDEQSSGVYGMNKVAFVEGHVDRQFALADAAAELLQTIQTQWPTTHASVASLSRGHGA